MRLLASCLVIPVLLFGGGIASAQATKAKAQNVPEIPFESVPNFLKWPPGLYLGEAMGVATNSKGHIFVYTRSANTRLFEFDQNGKYVREIGEGNYGFEFAHSVQAWSRNRPHRTCPPRSTSSDVRRMSRGMRRATFSSRTDTSIIES